MCLPQCERSERGDICGSREDRKTRHSKNRTVEASGEKGRAVEGGDRWLVLSRANPVRAMTSDGIKKDGRAGRALEIETPG